MSAEIVEVRCPVGFQRQFAKLRLTGEKPRYVQPDNLMEFYCSDCSAAHNKTHDPPVRIYHRYDFCGELIQTVHVPKG